MGSNSDGDDSATAPDGDGAETVAETAGTIRPATDRLLLDVMLGKLAVYLRVCGYDAVYALDRGIEADDRIAALAEREDRRLLTRDETLSAAVEGSILLTERKLEAQLVELRETGFDLEIPPDPSRCGRCNGRLDPVSETADTPEYAPDPETVECWRCRSCGQLFWKGSHYERMRKTIADALE